MVNRTGETGERVLLSGVPAWSISEAFEDGGEDHL